MVTVVVLTPFSFNSLRAISIISCFEGEGERGGEEVRGDGEKGGGNERNTLDASGVVERGEEGGGREEGEWCWLTIEARVLTFSPSRKS